MAEKRRQHYVPQFYLRLFAISGYERHVRLYNIDRDLYVERAPIQEQAAENNFYQSREIEDALGAFEGAAASILHQIIREKLVPKNKSDAFRDLLLFILLQQARTRYAADEFAEASRKMKEVVLNGLPESMLPPQLKGEIDNVPRFLMEVTSCNAWAARDLRAKLLINASPNAFITSDNPIVLYNRLLMLKRVPGGRTGIACRGLQLFFPLNPSLILHLFDGDVYFVGGKRHSHPVVEVSEPEDVFHLNQLQAVNANHNLYFNDDASKPYVQEILKSAARYRRPEKVSVEEYPAVEPTWLPRGSLLVHHRVEIDAPLDLSFIRLSHAGSRYDPRGKGAHVRDEQSLRAVEEPLIRKLQERLVGRAIAGIYAKQDHKDVNLAEKQPT